MKKIWLLVTLGLYCLVGLGGNAWSEVSQIDDYPRYPVMRPDPETFRNWLDQHEFMEKAYIDENIASSLMAAGQNDTGTSMNLLSRLQYIPIERNQNSCGNCWVWSGTGIMEINLNVSKGIKDRLSIQYLNSCRTSENSCCGGLLTDFADWYNTQKKAIPWANTNASFQDGSRDCDSDLSTVSCGSISTSQNYPISSMTAVQIPTQQGISPSSAIANIKNVLNQNKAVEFGFYLANSADWNNFFDFWENEPESTVWDPDIYCGYTWNSYSGAGHAVVIVGYDDTAWLVLNSWGTASGKRPNGLFRMKMDMNYTPNGHNLRFP